MADILDQYGNPIGWSVDRGNGRTDIYDLEGNMTGYSIARGNSGYADQYDANGYVVGTSYTDPDGNTTFYDNQGRQLQRQSPGAEQDTGSAAPQIPDKLSTWDAIRSLLIPSPEFGLAVRKDYEDTGEAVARYIMAAVLPVVTLLLAKAQLPYAVMFSVLTLLAFFISRSLLKQKLLTGLIFVNTVYTMLGSLIYSQFLWTFQTEGAEKLQYIVVGLFFLTGLVFFWKIESRGYYSYSITRFLEVVFFLALSVAWLVCFLLHTTSDTMRSTLNIIIMIQAIYSLIVLVNRLVELVNTVRSKSGVSESISGQMMRYVLYVVVLFAVKMLDPEAMPIAIMLVAISAVTFFLTRLNVLNRFRLVTVLLNSVYSVLLLGCYTNYLIHLYEWRPGMVVLLFILMLFTVFFLAQNLEQTGYASFKFTKLVSTLLLLAQAVLYVVYRFHIAQDFTWSDIRMLMKYILLGGAVFAAVTILIQLIAGGRKKPVPVTES